MAPEFPATQEMGHTDSVYPGVWSQPEKHSETLQQGKGKKKKTCMLDAIFSVCNNSPWYSHVLATENFYPEFKGLKAKPNRKLGKAHWATPQGSLLLPWLQELS